MSIITHQNMIKAGQTGCYGTFESLPVYSKGRLVGRQWWCRECGLTLTEYQMLVLLGELEPSGYSGKAIERKIEETL